MSVQKLAVVFLIATYLAASAYHLGRHALGDPYSHFTAYFWTWDMFPGFNCYSERRLALVETTDGRYLQVFPTPRQRYRGGVQGHLTRADLERSGACWRHVARRETARFAAEHPGQMRQAWLVEEYWPVRFNLSDARYERVYGEANPRRRYYTAEAVK